MVADRYLLHEVLGRGGAAEVYEATDQRLDRRVALKLLREAATSTSDRARFVSEARLLAGLSHHPGLVRILDAGVEGEHPFLALELVTGRDPGRPDGRRRSRRRRSPGTASSWPRRWPTCTRPASCTAT